MADEANAPGGKLKIDVKAAKQQAELQAAGELVEKEKAEQTKVYRDARWRQLFQSILEGASVGLVDELEEPDEDGEEEDEPIPSIEEQIRERAALTASAAALLADQALLIEIARGIT